jgi:tetratricopeptide (TPR) repeat protein
MMVLLLALLPWIAAAVDPETAQVVLPSSAAEVEIAASASPAVEQAVASLRRGEFERAAVAFRGLADSGGGPSLRYHEALAWYEAGQLRRAARAIEIVLRHDPDAGAALSLRGLILADLGQGDAAREVLDRAAERARASGDRALLARVLVNQGLIRLDLGDPDAAETRFDEALLHAQAAGDPATIALCERNLATARARRGAGPGGDELDRVAARLRQGDVAGARAAVPRALDQDRRGATRALLADAAVDRAEGRLDDANVKARTALGLARDAGLVRESGAALAQIGGLYMLAGRFGQALETFQEAIGTVAGTSLRVQELGYRVEAGRAAVRLGDLRQAVAQLERAEGVAARVDDAALATRLDELRGQLLEASGQVEEGARKLAAAHSGWERLGYPADAARVATDLVALHAGRSEVERARWAAVAAAAFAKAGDRAGPAHVEVASGLGFARRGQLEPALAAFARAAKLGEGLGTARGAQIAAHARVNAAQALKALGHGDAASARLAGGPDLAAAVAAQERFSAAEGDYEAGLGAFERGDHQAARQAFQRAVTGFERLGEQGLALRARRARGWAARNEALRLDPAAASALYELALRDGEAAGDAELAAKAEVGAALASAALGRTEAPRRLLAAAERAERAGMVDEAVQCLGELAERAGPLSARHAVVRRALALSPGAPEGVHAAYSLAVDAYNDGDHALALVLVAEIGSDAGPLAEAVEAVRSAAGEAVRAAADPAPP